LEQKPDKPGEGNSGVGLSPAVRISAFSAFPRLSLGFLLFGFSSSGEQDMLGA
jgi:hypothetical protein